MLLDETCLKCPGSGHSQQPDGSLHLHDRPNLHCTLPQAPILKPKCRKRFVAPPSVAQASRDSQQPPLTKACICVRTAENFAWQPAKHCWIVFSRRTPCLQKSRQYFAGCWQPTSASSLKTSVRRTRFCNKPASSCVWFVEMTLEHRPCRQNTCAMCKTASSLVLQRCRHLAGDGCCISQTSLQISLQLYVWEASPPSVRSCISEARISESCAAWAELLDGCLRGIYESYKSDNKGMKAKQHESAKILRLQSLRGRQRRFWSQQKRPQQRQFSPQTHFHERHERL